MSDTRVHDELVRWEFDNSDFEKKAAQTLTTLQRLEKALHINNVIDIAKGIKLDSLAKDVDQVAERFTNLGIIGKRVLENLADDAVKTGKKFISSLTIDDAKMGWNKYEEQVGAVQTLMNTTGFSANEIQKYVDRFALFSDETSYSLDQMVKSFSQMTTVADLSGTAAEKAEELKKIQDMIIGIANASAFAGKTGAEFQRTIFNLTQSYQTGALKLMDWKSLQQAGTASKQMMEQLIKAAEDLYKETNGKKGIAAGTITLQNFNDTLKKGWATTEVMQRAFGEFSSFANAALDAVAEGKYDTVSEAMADMADEFDDLSVKAFKSAQQAKTFTEAIASVHDAVSTKWSETYRIIVGDYDQAVTLWTNVANALWDIFAAGGDERNAMLAEWAQHFGRFYLIGSLQNVLNSILSFVEPIKSAWREVFTPITGRELAETTRQLFWFTRALILNGETQGKIKSVAKDFAQVIKNLLTLFKNAAKPIFDIIGPFDQLVNRILAVLKIISLLAKGLSNLVAQSEVATKAVTALMLAFLLRKHIGGTVKTVLTLSKALFTLVGMLRLVGLVATGVLIGGGLFKLGQWLTTGKGAEGIQKLTDKFKKFRDTINGFDSWKLEDYVNAIKNFGSAAKNAAFKKISEIFKSIDWKQILPANAIDAVDGIIDKFGRLKQVAFNLAQSIQAGGLRLMDWKSIVASGYGKESLKPFFESIVKAGVQIDKFKDIAKSGFAVAASAVKDFFSRDTLSGFSPFEEFIEKLKTTFTTKEGFLGALDSLKDRFKSMMTLAALPWKLSSEQIDLLKDRMRGLPAVIFNVSSRFKDFLGSLKNPETIETFGKTVSDAFGNIGSKALGGIDILTEGKFHDSLIKIGNAFSKVRSITNGIGTKGLDLFYTALKNIHSLIAAGGSAIPAGINRIKDAVNVLDVKVGGFASKIVNLLSTIKSRVPAVISPIFKLFDTLKGGKYSRILDLARSIFTDIGGSISKFGGDNFKAFTDSLKRLFDTFASGAPITKTISKLKDSISAFLGLFKRAETNISAPVRSMTGETNVVIETLYKFKDRLDYVINGIKDIANKINEIIPPELGSNIIKFVGLVAQLVIMNKVAKSIKTAFSDIGGAVKGAAEGFGNIFTPFKALGEGIPKIFAPFQALSEGLTKISETLDTAITTLTNSLGKKWKAEAFDVRARGLLKLAGAVAILAGAVWVVAQIPIENNELLYAAGAIAVLTAVLLTFATIFDRFGQTAIKEIPKMEDTASKFAAILGYFGKSVVLASLAVSLLAMAGAIRMLLRPIKELSEMRWQDFVKGFAEVAAMIGGLGFVMGKLATSLKGSAPSILAGTLLLLLSTKILKNFLNVMALYGEAFTGQSWGKMLAGALGVVAVVGGTTLAIIKIAQALSQFTANAKYVGGKVNPAAKALLATGVLLTSIVLFLMGMGDVIKRFKKLNVRIRDIAVVMTAIGGVLLAIAGYASILKIAHIEGPVRSAAGLLIGFAGALALVAFALNLFENLDLEAVVNALPVILGTIVTLLGVMWALGEVSGGMSLGSGLGIMGFALVIASLTGSLMLLTLLDYAKLEDASTSLAKVLLSVGVAMGLAGQFGGKLTSTVAFTFVIKELTSSLMILSFINYRKLESAADNLSKVLLSIGVTMALSGQMASSGIFGWIGIIALLGTIVFSLLKLQEVDTAKLKNVATVIGALEIVSGITGAIAGLSGGLPVLASLAGASLMIGAIAGLLYLIGTLPDPEKAAFVLNSCTVFFTAVGIVIGVLGKLKPYAGAFAALNVLEFILILGGVLAAFGELARANNDVSARMMEDFHLAFTEIGKFIGDIAAGFTNTLIEKAGDSLGKVKTFIEDIKGLKDAITADEANGINTTIGVVKDLLSLDIPNDGGLAGLIFGNNNIGDFGDSIFQFGLGIRGFAKSISGMEASADDVNNAITIANGLVDLANAIPNSGKSLAGALVGVKDLGNFAAQLAGETTSFAVGGDIGGGASKSFGEAADSNKGLGASIRKFVDSVKDIPAEGYKSAEKAIQASQAMADFAKHIPRSNGWAQKIAGAHDMGQFALSLTGDGTAENPGFALSIKKFVRAVSTMDDPSEAIAKLQATQPLLDMFKDNTGIFVDFKAVIAQADLDSGNNSFVTRVEMMKGYMSALSELQTESEIVDAGKITKIASAISASIPIMDFFDSNTGIFNSLDTSGAAAIDSILNGGESTILRAIDAAKEYAHKLALFGAYDYLDPAKYSSIAKALQASTPILNFYNENSGVIASARELIKTLFVGEKNPLEEAVERLIPYAQGLKAYSDEIDKLGGFGDVNKLIRSTDLLGIFASAVQKLFASQNLGGDNSFEYVEDFSGKLSSLATSMKGFSDTYGDTDLSRPVEGIKLLTETLEGMKNIGPLSADGFVTSINDLASVGITEFCNKFNKCDSEVNTAIGNFLTTAVGVLSRQGNVDRLKTGAQNLFKGYLEGQKQKLDEAKQELEKFTAELPNTLKINESVMINLGLKVTSGIQKGLVAGLPSLKKTAANVMDQAMTAVGEGVGDKYDDPVKGDESKYGKLMGLKIDAGIGKGITSGLNYISSGISNLKKNFLSNFEGAFGEKGSVLQQVKDIAGNTWENIRTTLTSGFQQLTGTDLASIWGDTVFFDSENGVDLLKGFWDIFHKTNEEGVEEAKKTTQEGAEAASGSAKKASSDAIKAAKAANKEILSDEDAFWVALLSKKRLGANGAEYQDMKVKDFEKKMLQEVNKLVDDYKEKLNSTTDDILGMIGLFDKVEDKAKDSADKTEETFTDLFKGIGDKASKLEGNIEDLFRRVDTATKSGTSTVSGDELMANLQDQIDKYTEFYDIQDALASRIHNSKLKKTLREMTIDSVEELKALNSMSDKQLDEYVQLFEKRVEVAGRGKTKEAAEDATPTAEVLTQNLEDQVEKYKEYKEVITNLNARVTSKKLKETLNAMDIDNMEQLKVIESMTDEELTHYTALFEEKYQLSKDTAEVKLEETKQVTEDKLNELLETTGLQLDMFLEKFDGTLGSLTSLIEGYLTGNTLGNAVGHMAQQLVDALLAVFNNGEISAEEKVAQITKAIADAAAAGVDLTDQYSQGVQAILANTEMTAEQKLAGILELMSQSQASLAQTSQNLAQTTKDTIARILSRGEVTKLISSLMATLNDGVLSAQEKIEKFKIAIQQAGESNVQLTETYRTYINQLLADTTTNASSQVMQLLDILQAASADYQQWALQDINSLNTDLLNLTKISANGVGGTAKASHDIIKEKLRATTDASEEELETMTENVTSTLSSMTSDALSSQEAFSSAVQGIVTANCDATKQQAQDAADALGGLYSEMKQAQSLASSMDDVVTSAAGSSGSSGSDGGGSSSKDNLDGISRWEKATGRTLSEAHRQFAMSGGAIIGSGGNIIKDGRYWDSANRASYDLGSGAAHNAIKGYSDTISNGVRTIYAAGAETYHAYSEGLTGPGGLDEHSPSKKMMKFARFALMGWVQGIDKYIGLMTASGNDTANSYVDVFNESIRSIDMPADISPVITPVIDMSRAQASMDALDALFNTEKSYSMASDIKRVADIAQRAKAEASKPVNQEPVKATTMNFTQNNYSPKALSKLDIYRQTKNQFAQMKGALG